MALTKQQADDLALQKRIDPAGYAQRLHDARAQKGRDDFWYFSTKILKNPVLYEPLHKPICEWLQHWDKTKKLLLIPRGHVKSNIGTIQYALWRIVRDRNIRILIASHKAPDSQKFLRLIKAWIKDDTFRSLYPEIKPKMTTVARETIWREDAILLERDVKLVESTVETTSLTCLVTGRHYDLLIGDDLVTDKNVATAEQLQATVDFHAYCQALLDPGAQELLIGTPYDFSDLYATIRNTPDKARDYEIMVRSAEEDGAPIYPTRFTMAEDDEIDPVDPKKTKKSLPKLRRTMGSWIYSSQYMCDPVDDKTAVFKRHDVELMDVDKLPEGDMNYFRVCDMSTDKQTKDSRTSIVTGAVDKQANIYITHIYLGNYTPYQIIDELIRGQRVEVPIRPILVGFEPAMFERILKTFLRQKASEEGVLVPVKFLDSGVAQRSKDERIMGLQPWVEAHKVKVLHSCPNKEAFFTELIKYPRYKLKDTIDAVAQIEHFMWPAGKPESAFSAPARVDARAWFEKAMKRYETLDPNDKRLGNDRIMARIPAIRMAR